MEKLIFESEEGEKLEFYIIESTRLAGKDYILVTDVAAGDGDCFILRDNSSEDSEDSVYEFVEDDKELDYLINVFAELVDDADLAF